MESPDHYRPRRSRRSRSSLLLPISILCLAFAILAGAVIIYFKTEGSPDRSTSPSMEDAGQISGLSQQDASPPVVVEPLQSGPSEKINSSIESQPPADPDTADGSSQQLPPFAEDQTSEQNCGLMAEQLHSFFLQLDEEEYIRAFSLNKPTQLYFTDLAEKLLANPPVVTRESDELYTILKNMAHFFRIIGKQNILVIKGILDREREQIEDIAATGYQWVVSESCSSDLFELKAPLDKLYEYAGFFLNTMGGRSYLFRRDSRSRLLVNYYSILIVDQADSEGLNSHGIDTKEVIPQLIGEIDATNQLIYKEAYLDHLYDLLERNE